MLTPCPKSEDNSGGIAPVSCFAGMVWRSRMRKLSRIVGIGVLVFGLSATMAAAQNLEIVFWKSIQSSNNPADFEAYLEQFPNGNFAILARNRLRALKARRSATSRPPQPRTQQQSRPQPAGGSSASGQPGKTFRDCSDCPLMVVVPSGSGAEGMSAPRKSAPMVASSSPRSSEPSLQDVTAKKAHAASR